MVFKLNFSHEHNISEIEGLQTELDTIEAGAGGSKVGTFEELYELFESEDEVIVLDKDYRNTDNFVFNENNYYTVPPKTIIGNGHIIDFNNLPPNGEKTLVFNTTQGTTQSSYSINDCVFANIGNITGSSQYLVFTSSSNYPAVLNQCIFYNNNLHRSDTINEVIFGCYLKNCFFIKNNTFFNIYNVENCSFINNIATNKSLISLDSYGKIYNSLFALNKPTGNVVLTQSADNIIQNCTFYGNQPINNGSKVIYGRGKKIGNRQIGDINQNIENDLEFSTSDHDHNTSYYTKTEIDEMIGDIEEDMSS